MAADGVDVAGDGLRPLRHALPRPAADTRTRGSPPSPSSCSAGRPGRSPRSPRRRPASLFPPLGPVHRVLHAPARPGSTAGAWPPRCAQAAAARGVAFVTGCGRTASRRAAAAPAGAHVEAVEVEGHRNVTCAAVAVAGGAWTAAVGEWLGTRLPVGPTKGQIVHLGVERGDGRLADRAAAAHPLSRAVARRAGGLRRHVRGRRRVLRQRHRSGPARAPARMPDDRARDWTAPPTSRRGSGCGPRRPTTAPSWAGCRAGATPGWRPDTAPTACCRVPTRRGCWRTPWRAWRCRRTSRRCRASFDPGRFA